MIQKFKQTRTPARFSLKRSKNQHLSTAISSSFQIDPNEQRFTHIQNKKQSFMYKHKEDDLNFAEISTIPYTQYQQEVVFEHKQSKMEDLKDVVSKNIDKDNQISVKENNLGYRHNSYLQQQNRIATSAAYDIPQYVQKIAQKLQREMGKKINIVQGFIKNCGYIYYAIDKILVLYDCKDIINSENHQNHFKNPEIIEISQILVTIKQIKLKSQIFPQSVQDKILIFSHPWQLLMYSYSIECGKFKLNSLGVKYSLNCERVIHLDYCKNGTIYYLDENGYLNSLKIIQNSMLINFFKQGKYSLKNYRLSRNQFPLGKLIETTSITKNLKAFFKSFYKSCRSILPGQCQTIGMFVDRQRNLAFTISQFTSNTIFRDKNRIIHGYSLRQNNPTIIYRLSDEQFFSNFQLQLVYLDRKTLKIDKIGQVSKSLYPISNIQIILKNGIKIYLNISEIKLTFIDLTYPPDYKKFISNKQQYEDIEFTNGRVDNWSFMANIKQKQDNVFKENIIPPRQSTQYQLLSEITDHEKFINICKINKKMFSYMVSNKNQKCQRQNISEIKWDSNTRRQIPLQLHLYKITDEALLQLNEQILLKIGDNSNQSNLDYSFNQQCQDLHELAKQTHFLPEHYIFSTQQSIQAVVYLRNIDIAFTIINSTYESYKMVAEKLIVKYFSKQSVKQILSILYQIYNDQQGVYFVSKLVEDKIYASVHNKIYNQQKSNRTVRKVKYSSIPKRFFIEILALVQILLSKQINNKPIPRHTHNNFNLNNYKVLTTDSISTQKNNATNPQRDLKIESLMLYFSRLIRIVWNTPLDLIPLSKNNILINKLETFKKNSQVFLDIAMIQAHTDTKAYNYFMFIRKIIQILYMAQNIIGWKYPLNVCDCLEKPVDFFEQFIFTTIVNRYNAKVLQSWQQLFPLFITTSLKKSIRLYSQLQEEQSIQKVDPDIIVKYFGQKVPEYFKKYLIVYKQIKDFELIQIMSKYNKEQQQKKYKI